MNKLKNKAFELRRQEKSYNEISKILSISKSTLSYWFKKDRISSKIKKILINKVQKKAVQNLRRMALINKEKWKKIHLSYRQNALNEFLKLILDPLFIPGLIIYWGEGDKKLENGIVRIANTDYRMLKIFISFLLNTCKINVQKIRLWLLLYPDLNEEKCKKYWSKALDVSTKQFIKSQYIKGREKKRRVTSGVCYVQVCSRELKEKIIEWINLYSQKLVSAGMV